MTPTEIPQFPLSLPASAMLSADGLLGLPYSVLSIAPGVRPGLYEFTLTAGHLLRSGMTVFLSGAITGLYVVQVTAFPNVIQLGGLPANADTTLMALPCSLQEVMTNGVAQAELLMLTWAQSAALPDVLDGGLRVTRAQVPELTLGYSLPAPEFELGKTLRNALAPAFPKDKESDDADHVLLTQNPNANYMGGMHAKLALRHRTRYTQFVIAGGTVVESLVTTPWAWLTRTDMGNTPLPQSADQDLLRTLEDRQGLAFQQVNGPFGNAEWNPVARILGGQGESKLLAPIALDDSQIFQSGLTYTVAMDVFAPINRPVRLMIRRATSTFGASFRILTQTLGTGSSQLITATFEAEEKEALVGLCAGASDPAHPGQVQLIRMQVFCTTLTDHHLEEVYYGGLPYGQSLSALNARRLSPAMADAPSPLQMPLNVADSPLEGSEQADFAPKPLYKNQPSALEWLFDEDNENNAPVTLAGASLRAIAADAAGRLLPNLSHALTYRAGVLPGTGRYGLSPSAVLESTPWRAWQRQWAVYLGIEVKLPPVGGPNPTPAKFFRAWYMPMDFGDTPTLGGLLKDAVALAWLGPWGGWEWAMAFPMAPDPRLDYGSALETGEPALAPATNHSFPNRDLHPGQRYQIRCRSAAERDALSGLATSSALFAFPEWNSGNAQSSRPVRMRCTQLGASSAYHNNLNFHLLEHSSVSDARQHELGTL